MVGQCGFNESKFRYNSRILGLFYEINHGIVREVNTTLLRRGVCSLVIDLE